MSASTLDPIAFAADALEARGAAVERGAGTVLALLPPPLAAALGVTETCTLTAAPTGPDEVACTLGAPVLERLLALERGHVPRACVKLGLGAPRATAARSLAERFAPRNAVADVRELREVERAYVTLYASWTATADDRHEGLVAVTACAVDGTEPPRAWSAALDPCADQGTLGSALAGADDVQAAAQWLASRTALEAVAASEPLRELARRRAARDHDRIAEYYAAVAADTASRRRRVDEAALAATLAHVATERDQKLRELGERYAMRVSVTPVALVVLVAPAVEVLVRIRRRKAERVVTLRLAAGAAALDGLACEGCALATGKPAFCDDRVHALCERCAPTAEGRLRCPACATRTV
jgi:hypothetical protein